jgi:hypothetical protein
VLVGVSLLFAGCAESKEAADGTGTPPTTQPPPPPTTVAAPKKKKAKPKPRRPHLPRMQGEVLAVGHEGRDYTKAYTVFLTLDGRELAQLRGYLPNGDSFYLSGKSWTLRDGRVVPGPRPKSVHTSQGNCYVLARTAAGTLVSCNAKVRALQLLGDDGDLTPLVPPPHRAMGHWYQALVSPDGAQLLLTWSGECESPNAFIAPAAGGDPVPFTGEADWTKAQESYALGWTRDGRALAYLTEGICGPGGGRPGVYSRAERTGAPTLVARGTDAAFFPG